MGVLQFEVTEFDPELREMGEAIERCAALLRDAEARLRDDLLHAYHILDADGQASGIAGHLTARLPGAKE